MDNFAQDVARHFDENAQDLASSYDSVSFDSLYAPLIPCMRMAMGRALDVGCGSGRDAEALARLGFAVTAVDRSVAMLEHAMASHGGHGIDWIEDSLPHLESVDGTFDLVCCFAVWMFLAADERDAAMERLAGLLSTNGLLTMSLRHGPVDGRPMLDVPADEVIVSASAHGLAPVLVERVEDEFRRDDVHWTLLAFARG